MSTEVWIEHPNRHTRASRSTRATAIALLIASALILAVVTVGAWDALVGARPLQTLFLLLYAGAAVLVARWSRGVLPVVAALAAALGVFAGLSVPGWFSRDEPWSADTALGAEVIGWLCAVLALGQILLAVVALRGFRQAWNVEVEHRDTEPARRPRSAPA